jgi:GNAT superfamily N-acetyltransferase
VNEAEWEAFSRLKREDWVEHRRKQDRPAEPGVAEAMVRVDRGKCPPVRYFLAYQDGDPAAYFNAWGGIDGIGQVEDLFTLPGYRNKGLATALIHHCVAHCRDNGAKQVVIVADPADTPKQIYANLGFRPLAVNANYLKRIDAS